MPAPRDAAAADAGDPRDDGTPRRRADRLLGGAAQESAPGRPRDTAAAPPALRRAALLVALEALAALVIAVVVLFLTLTSTADSTGRALAEVAYALTAAAALGFCAWGLGRAAPWARGPVVVLQLLLGLTGYVTAFESGLPFIGVPVLACVAGVLWFLATPEARLAYSQV